MQAHKLALVQIYTGSHWNIVLHRARERERKDINSPLGVKWTRQHKDTVAFTHKRTCGKRCQGNVTGNEIPLKWATGGERSWGEGLSCHIHTSVGSTVFSLWQNNAEYIDCKQQNNILLEDSEQQCEGSVNLMKWRMWLVIIIIINVIIGWSGKKREFVPLFFLWC